VSLDPLPFRLPTQRLAAKCGGAPTHPVSPRMSRMPRMLCGGRRPSRRPSTPAAIISTRGHPAQASFQGRLASHVGGGGGGSVPQDPSSGGGGGTLGSLWVPPKAGKLEQCRIFSFWTALFVYPEIPRGLKTSPGPSTTTTTSHFTPPPRAHAPRILLAEFYKGSPPAIFIFF